MENVIRKFIRHYFEDSEKLDLSNKMSEAIISKNRFEADLKTVQSQFRSRIQEASAEISGLAQKINSGWEMQEIQCRVIKDFDDGVIRFQSIETDEIVEERPMTIDERQMRLGENDEKAGEGQEATGEEGQEEKAEETLQEEEI